MASSNTEQKETNPSRLPNGMKIIVIGASSVGKTSLIHQFVYGKLQPVTNDVVEDFFAMDMDDVDGEKIQLHILDTKADFEFPEVMRLAIKTGDAFILVYAVDDKESYQTINFIRQKILKERKRDMKKVPMVVVGNKADIDPSERIISKDIAEAIVSIDWNCTYMEISTRNKDNVDDVFRELLQRYRGHEHVYNQRRMTSPAEVFSKLKRRLTLKKQKSTV